MVSFYRSEAKRGDLCIVKNLVIFCFQQRAHGQFFFERKVAKNTQHKNKAVLKINTHTLDRERRNETS